MATEPTWPPDWSEREAELDREREKREAESKDAERMRLRDYFAGKALAGLLSQPEALTVPLGTSVAEWYATTAYDYAAAMLAERERSR